MANPLMPLKWSLYLRTHLKLNKTLLKMTSFSSGGKVPTFMEQEKLRKKILANLIVLCRLNSTFVPTSLDNSSQEIL